ncbi:hypothetical protein M422DRAFT_33068, partial [Sphaerobolus stellatus SS14]
MCSSSSCIRGMRWRVLHVRIVMLGIGMKACEEDRAAGLARPGEDGIWDGMVGWLLGRWYLETKVRVSL